MLDLLKTHEKDNLVKFDKSVLKEALRAVSQFGEACKRITCSLVISDSSLDEPRLFWLFKICYWLRNTYHDDIIWFSICPEHALLKTVWIQKFELESSSADD